MRKDVKYYDKNGSTLKTLGVGKFMICLICFRYLWGYIKGYLGDHCYLRRGIYRGIFFLTACLVVMIIKEPLLRHVLSPPKAEAVMPIVQAAEVEKPEVVKETETKADIRNKKTENVRKEKKEPLDNSPMELNDVYTEQGSTVSFKAYHPKAAGYTWEVYDQEKNLWDWVPQENVCSKEDELFREVSVCNVVADTEKSVRCQISIPQNPPVKYEADIHLIGKVKEIRAKDICAEVGQYVSAQNIPVQVIYQDGSKDTITGLEGLYFLEKEESTEHSITALGNQQDTITTVKTAKEYVVANLGTQDHMLCYRKIDEDSISVTVTGMDMQAPQINELDIGSIAVSNVDEPVTITVRISAKDNLTPEHSLEYAFLPEGHEPRDADWRKESSFEAKVSNGTWKAYCRDQSGNVATKEQEILVVDTVAPVIELELENKEWCTKNRIYVSVEDSLPVEYRYQCEKEDSGWVKEAVKDVDQNGNWNIQVRDAAGNVSEQEITVANIDKQPPVIRGITEKSEGEARDNEK